jgi:hypothetical protein
MGYWQSAVLAAAMQWLVLFLHALLESSLRLYTRQVEVVGFLDLLTNLLKDGGL